MVQIPEAPVVDATWKTSIHHCYGKCKKSNLQKLHLSTANSRICNLNDFTTTEIWQGDSAWLHGQVDSFARPESVVVFRVIDSCCCWAISTGLDDSLRCTFGPDDNFPLWRRLVSTRSNGNMSVVADWSKIEFDSFDAFRGETVKDRLVMVSVRCVELDWQLILLVFIIENIFNRCDERLTLRTIDYES